MGHPEASCFIPHLIDLMRLQLIYTPDGQCMRIVSMSDCDPPNTLCLNRSTGRNLTSELEALTLSPQREPLGLISPHTSYFPCKARSSCVTARLVEGSLYTSASDRMVGTTTVNLARGGRSQLKTSEPSAGRGIHLSLWMVRPIECPRRLW